MTTLLLILSLILFVGLVIAHEWGHFIAARRGGVDVEEFGIGFPPKVWSRKIKTKKSRFVFSFNLLPLGGFVRLFGEHDSDTWPGSFGAAPLATKVRIMLAGVAVNLLIAYFLFVILALAGMPKLIDGQYTVPSDTKVIQHVKDEDVVLVDDVVAGSPASKAALQAKDRVLSIGGSSITSPEQVAVVTKENAGKSVEIKVLRDNKEVVLSATLNSENTGNGYLGISSSSGSSGLEVRRSSWSAPIVAGGLLGQFSGLTFKGLGTAVASLAQGDTQKASEQVSGPVGIFYILKEGGKLGINFILMIIAIISLTLALINALPIPALDGGRLFVTLVFRAMHKPLSKRREEFIHGSGFAFLMLIFVLVTFVDIRRFF